MTYTYLDKLSHVHDGQFIKLVKVYKASTWKICQKEAKFFIIFYIFIHLFYNILCYFQVTSYYEKLSGLLKVYQEKLTPSITFVIGFYVTIVVNRWWNQWEQIKYNDRIAHNILTTVIQKSKDDQDIEQTKLIRRTLMRYIHLGNILVYRLISSVISDRYPSYEHIISEGILTQKEKTILQNTNSLHEKFWMPFAWFSNLAVHAYDNGHIRSAVGFKEMITEMNDVFSSMEILIGYDWVNVPLVYSQTVIIAVWAYLICNMVGMRYVDFVNFRISGSEFHEGHDHELIKRSINGSNNLTDPDSSANYVYPNTPKHDPFDQIIHFSVDLLNFFIKFIFFMGWLKVAEQLINPFGFDDDDFEINQIVDRNFEVCMRIVDSSDENCPSLEKDGHFGLGASSGFRSGKHNADSRLFCKNKLHVTKARPLEKIYSGSQWNRLFDRLNVKGKRLSVGHQINEREKLEIERSLKQAEKIIKSKAEFTRKLHCKSRSELKGWGWVHFVSFYSTLDKCE